MGKRVKTKRRLISLTFIICQLSLGIALTSCGDLFEFEGETSELNSIELDTHSLYLMAGDTYKFSVTFTPDVLRNNAIYWISDDPSIASFEDGVLLANSAGETDITGFSVEHQCADKCHVVVGYGWYMPDHNYPFDMVVNADITVGGKPLTESMQVGAFVGNQLRGIGVQRQFFGVNYTELRIYSPLKPYAPDENKYPLLNEDQEQEAEIIVFRVYDRDTHTLYESPNTLIFDGLVHGYLSSLYPIVLNLEKSTE